MTVLEFLAAFFGILYLGFISFHKRMGWFFGCVSSGIYIFICWQQALFIQAVLQFFYVILGVFGYVHWNENIKIIIERVPQKSHVIFIVLGFILSLFLGKLMSMTNQELPYLDATISIFSILATILATKSIIENWIYWVLCNILSIILFSIQGLEVTTFLYIIYLIGSIFGYNNWRKLIIAQSKIN